jgi:hypothetical protein
MSFSSRFIVGLLALTGRIAPGTAGFLVSTGLEFTSRILYVVRAINQNELNSAFSNLSHTCLMSDGLGYRSQQCRPSH